MDFQILWLLVIAPLYNLYQALANAWTDLKQAADDEERKEIVERAGAQAFVSTIMAIVVAAADFPYNLLGLIPSFVPVINRMFGGFIYFSIGFRARRP